VPPVQVRARRLTAVAAAAVATLATAALTGAGGAGAAAPADELRRQHAALERASRSALLELYALEAQMAAARRASAAAERRVAVLVERQAQLSSRLERVRTDAALAESLLAERLRALYETPEVDPLAVILGAASLEQAVTGLENLRFVVEGDRRIAAQTRAAQRELRAAAATLAELRAEAEAAATVAAERAEAVEQAHAERSAHVARLADEERLTATRISELEQQARAAQERSDELSRSSPPLDDGVGAPLSAAAPAPLPAHAPAPGAADGAPATPRTLTVVATAYALPGRTATGMPVGHGVVAVDPSVIPLGTRMTIPGYGAGVAADTGGAIKGLKIDVWMPSRVEALRWGTRTVTITLGSD
jgi:3D (Asp-Asp-Asp) domain-containing protein/peptidoglycan hydrolase CwlO-like protein